MPTPSPSTTSSLHRSGKGRRPLPLVPVPLHLAPGDGAPFVVAPGTAVMTGDSTDEVAVGVLLTGLISSAVDVPLALGTGTAPGAGGIAVRLDDGAGPADRDPEERYELRVTALGVAIRAPRPAGLVRGAATLRQLLTHDADGDVVVPPLTVLDAPRYPWRGLSLDLSRHVLDAGTVLTVLCVMTELKLNVLHLHRSDDPGWRPALPSRPEGVERSAETEVGVGPGGDLSAEDCDQILVHAAARHITVVPDPGTVVRWCDPRGDTGPLLDAARGGARVLLSPAPHVCLDLEDDVVTPSGRDRPVHVELRDAYGWEPADAVPGLPRHAVVGIEAAVRSRTLRTTDDLFTTLLPRLAAVAEVAWSAPEGRGWAGFRRRVAQLADGWDRDGYPWHPSPQVEWL